tara:strand:+ start:7834 stop:8637 length:804 start_codon:yes stop_codon:yes gene_type:complete
VVEIMGGREIDHLVLAVRELETAALTYQRLGFKLTPQAQHPFGTGNRLAQLQGNFIEILSVTEPDWVSESGEEKFSFGAYNRNFLARREGISMVSLQSTDWLRDRIDFEMAGLSLHAPFAFTRMAVQPDGTEVEMGFDLTFAFDPSTPNVVFFTCCHRHSLNHFYKVDYQAHPNGAERISAVFIESTDVAGTERRLSALGVNRTLFEIVSGQRDAFTGFAMDVSDLSVTRQILLDSGLDLDNAPDAVTIGPDSTFGVTVKFREEVGA